MRNHPLSILVATAAIVLSPALILSMKGGTGYCYFVVLALALVYLSRAPHRRRAAELWRTHRTFLLGLVALPAVVLFQIVVTRTGRLSELDPLLRLALAVPSFFFLASLDARRLRLVQWGMVAGALATGAWSLYATFHPPTWVQQGRLGNWFTNPIPFGDTALLLGFLSVASIERGRRAHVAEIVLKWAAVLAGGYASFLSGSRGGWVAVPFLIWTAVSGRHWLSNRRACAVFAVGLAVGIGVLIATNGVRERFEALDTDVQAMQAGNLDTSTGLRLDLWRASILLYERHPVLGVGRGGLEAALGGLAAHGEAPQAIVNGRAHSEFFSVLAEMGTIGVAALLLFYASGFAAFWRQRRDPDPEVVTAAYLGLALVGSTILFGLTIDVLTLVMNSAFYGLTAVTLLAWIDARQRATRAVSRA